MRVLLDANVFVAALLRSRTARVGSCRAILEAFRDGQFSLITAEPLVDELVQVLGRPKFNDRISPEDRRNLLELVRTDGEFVVPRRSALLVRDPKDRPVLECAYAADLLVSGDHDLQVLGSIGSTSVLSPSAFLALLKSR